MAIHTKLEKPSEVQEFYKGKAIFLTGATGFLGKCIVEKIWRTCTDVSSLYLLMRPKKDKSAKDRLNEMLSVPLFEKVLKECPEFRKKIRIINGDISLPELGLSDEDRNILIENVNIVIHGAATVRFDEKLKLAIEINVRGTRDLVRLCKKMMSFDMFVHISTAYSHCVRMDIDEVFYDSPMPHDDAIKLTELLDAGTLDKMTSSLLGKWPNTYSFTKALGEEVVRQESEGLPAIIFRPSIVISTLQEPIAGWIDVIYGPVGLLIGLGYGLIHTLQVEHNKTVDLVPADMVVSALLCSPYQAKKEGALKPCIYNFVSGPQTGATWGVFSESVRKINDKLPVNSAVYYPAAISISNYTVFRCVDFVFHYIPARILDLILKLSESKIDVMRIYKKGHKLMSMLRYFMVGKSFIFSNKAVERMWSELKDDDKQLFPFDVKVLDFDEMIFTFCSGIRRYILKHDDSTLEKALSRHRRLKYIHYTLKFFVYAGILYLLFLLFRMFF